MRAQRSTSAPNPALFLLTLAALCLGAFNLWRYSDYLLDDTFISLRYARNLVEGNGLVFNPGEYVEGYTNFLFVILSALFLRGGVDPILATKAVVVAATAWMLFVLVRFEGLGPRPMRFPLVLLLLLPLEAFAYWAVASFETMLFTALFIWALWLGLKEAENGRWRGASLVFVLLALTRPEGVFLFFVCTAAFLLVERRAWGRVRWAVVGVNLFIFLALFGAYFAWRYAYYGDLLPNTFRAKVTGGAEQIVTGLGYAKDWALALPFFALSLAVPPALVLPRVRARLAFDRRMLAVALVALAYAAYIVAVGGDFMPYFRFFVPLMPLCALVLSWTLASLVGSSLRMRETVLAGVLVLHITVSLFSEESYRAFVAHRTAVIGRWVGERIAEQLAPNDLIAVNTAGSLPYYSARPAIDMLGLTDSDIARRPVFIVSPGWAGHRRGWGEYVLNRQPRLIFFYNSSGSREPFYLSDHELADNPSFRFFYRLKALRIPAHGDNIAEIFLGFPFGFDANGRSAWPDLGLAATFHRRVVPYTVFREARTVANFFELDARDSGLWPRRGNAAAVDSLLQAAVDSWSAQPPPSVVPAAREHVEQLCAQAYERLQAGDRDAAKSLLTQAIDANREARSPLPYQYAANVAVLDGDLFTAVGAQKEALRIAPHNTLYRSNLKNLLTTPYREATRGAGSDRHQAP